MNQAPPNVLPLYEQISEPTLSFHPDRPTDVDVHPLAGLLRFGPYCRKLPISAADPIRLAIIAPEGTGNRVLNLLAEFNQSQRPRERHQYLPEFGGFSRVFGVGLDAPTPGSVGRVLSLPNTAIDAALSSQRPYEPLSELIHRSVRQLNSSRQEFDVALLYLPDALASGFKSDPADEEADFDLHDSVKALSSTLRLPVQILNDDAITYKCRCSVAWRLSLALFTKAGGIPWKLDRFEERHAYVGLSYCVRKASRAQFVTCCSQIFDAEGTNLRFLLYESADGRYEGENPFLPRGDMYRVMARTLALYQKQKGIPPTRLVVHKTTPFTPDEIDGCNDALSSVDDVELLTVGQRVSWSGIRIDPPTAKGSTKGIAAKYPIERGATLPLGVYEFLLWTQGNCSGIGKGTYFKEGKGIPHPLRITRYQGMGGFHASARELMALTKMNWNNDSLYDRLPVTLSYASILARVVKRMGSLSQTPYDFRFFM